MTLTNLSAWRRRGYWTFVSGLLSAGRCRVGNTVRGRSSDRPARVKLALELKPALEEQARERKDANLKQGTTVPDVANLPHRENGRTRDKVAALAGVSSRKLSEAEYVLTKAPAFIRDAYEALNIAAHPAYELARRRSLLPCAVLGRRSCCNLSVITHNAPVSLGQPARWQNYLSEEIIS